MAFQGNAFQNTAFQTGASAAAPADDTVFPQMSAMGDMSHFGDPEVEEYQPNNDHTATPPIGLEVGDISTQIFRFFELVVDWDEEEFQPQWQTAPPTYEPIAPDVGEYFAVTYGPPWPDDPVVIEGWYASPQAEADQDVRLPQGVFDLAGEEEDEVLDGTFSEPSADAPDEIVLDTSLVVHVEEDEELTEGFVARGLAFPDDETGETTGRQSNNDWVDEDEPISDGHFATPAEESVEETRFLQTSLNDWTDEDEPLTEGFTARGTGMPQDETGETTGQASNNDWTDEDEPETLGFFGEPLEDAPPAVVEETTSQLLGEVFDDDEPVTDGFFAGPIEETHEDVQVLDTSNLDWTDEDEPETQGWFSSPLEDAPAPNTDRVASSFPADADLEEPEFPAEFFSGSFGSPLEDTPEVEPTTVGGYPWYADRRKKKKLVFPYVEEPELPPAVRKAKKKAEQAALVQSLRVEVPKGPIPLTGNAALLEAATDATLRRMAAEAAEAERKQREEARLQAELRRVQEDLAKAEAMMYDYFLEESYKESARLLAIREARRLELEKEEEQLLIQLAAEYF